MPDETTEKTPKPAKATKASAAADKAAEKVQQARKKNLDLALTHIQKEFGETAIMRLGDDNSMDIDVIPTGNLLIGPSVCNEIRSKS